MIFRLHFVSLPYLCPIFSHCLCCHFVPAVVEREPVLTGKPATFLLQEIMSSHGVRPEEMLMVGDRLDTDILWGQSTGMDTCLVLTGGGGDRSKRGGEGGKAGAGGRGEGGEQEQEGWGRKVGGTAGQSNGRSGALLQRPRDLVSCSRDDYSQFQVPWGPPKGGRQKQQGV